MSLSKKFQKGFTLIELLVVIAIIGILAAIVLAALTNSRDQASEKAMISQMSSMRSQGELYFSTNNNSFGTTATAGGAGSQCGASSTVFGGTTNSLATLLAATPVYGGTSTNRDCDSNGTAWAVAYQVGPSLYYCVDSTGYLNFKNKAATPAPYTQINSGLIGGGGAKAADAAVCW